MMNYGRKVHEVTSEARRRCACDCHVGLQAALCTSCMNRHLEAADERPTVVNVTPAGRGGRPDDSGRGKEPHPYTETSETTAPLCSVCGQYEAAHG